MPDSVCGSSCPEVLPLLDTCCVSQPSLSSICPVRQGSRALQADGAAYLLQALTTLLSDMDDVLQGAAACRSHA